MGFSCIDIFTGNVNLFQYTQTANNIHEPCILMNLKDLYLFTNQKKLFLFIIIIKN